MSPRASTRKQFTSHWTLGGLTPSAGAHDLSVGLYWWILSALLAVGYFLFISTMFRGKVQMDEGGYRFRGLPRRERLSHTVHRDQLSPARLVQPHPLSG